MNIIFTVLLWLVLSPVLIIMAGWLAAMIYISFESTFRALGRGARWFFTHPHPYNSKWS